jgi:hypothetical protein
MPVFGAPDVHKMEAQPGKRAYLIFLWDKEPWPAEDLAREVSRVGQEQGCPVETLDALQVSGPFPTGPDFYVCSVAIAACQQRGISTDDIDIFYRGGVGWKPGVHIGLITVIWGGKLSAEHPTETKLPSLSFPEQLKALLSTSRPTGWMPYDVITSSGADLYFAIPPAWNRRVDQNGALFFWPQSAREISDGSETVSSPCLGFFEMYEPARNEDDTFDAWLEQMKKMFRGFLIRNSERFSEGELRILAVEYNFDKAGSKWTSYTTLRMKGRHVWYFDASGLASDMNRFRNDLIMTLALLTVG